MLFRNRKWWRLHIPPRLVQLDSPPTILFVRMTSLLFLPRTCLSGHSFGHSAGFTVTAHANVWFVANAGKWADHIHQAAAAVPLLRHCPGSRVYFSFVIDSVAPLILRWLMTLHPPTCFSPPDRWNLSVSALLEDIIVHNRRHLWWMMFVFMFVLNKKLEYHFWPLPEDFSFYIIKMSANKNVTFFIWDIKNMYCALSHTPLLLLLLHFFLSMSWELTLTYLGIYFFIISYSTFAKTTTFHLKCSD